MTGFDEQVTAAEGWAKELEARRDAVETWNSGVVPSGYRTFLPSPTGRGRTNPRPVAAHQKSPSTRRAQAGKSGITSLKTPAPPPSQATEQPTGPMWTNCLTCGQLILRGKLAEHRSKIHLTAKATSPRSTRQGQDIARAAPSHAPVNMVACPACRVLVRADRLESRHQRRCPKSVGTRTRSSTQRRSLKQRDVAFKPGKNSGATRSSTIQNTRDPMDASPNGRQFRERTGRFGSYPLHDSFAEDAWP